MPWTQRYGRLVSTTQGVGVPVLSSLPRLPNSPLAKCGWKRHALDLYGLHLHSSLRCNQNARLDSVRTGAVVPHGRTHGTHSTRRDGKRRPTARRCGDSELPSGCCRMHGEFLRLLFLQVHRETEAHCSWNVIAKLPNGRVPFQARGVPSVTEEQDRPRSLQSGSVENQPQYPGFRQPQCTLLLALPFSSPSFFHTISLPPAFARA